MGFMGIFNSIENVIQSIADEIKVDQSVLDGVKAQLRSSHQELESIRFGDVALPESAFGGAPSGNTLGRHHSLAHEVISDTLTGLLEDLTRFRDGIVTAEKLIEQADTSTADDLTRGRQAVEAIVGSTRHSEADQRNHESRNHYLGNGGGRR
ncbi:hypothetical protein FB382_003620 [Nocardioides ginsengisegetis]|uniref:Excreted virulence factor EspC, type VII ESX diderm n=1 Tax=Nocardioides ginsengisegetis TaxID=661491 RepID=A0A7W3J392_9ACTN|nr:hypothetical protein [Nocardioides ginsengisegetis]MBA8805329.1 hypothetical protein [Nocardioides ginsengisegetis]